MRYALSVQTTRNINASWFGATVGSQQGSYYPAAVLCPNPGQLLLPASWSGPHSDGTKLCEADAVNMWTVVPQLRYDHLTQDPLTAQSTTSRPRWECGRRRS